MSLKGRKVPTSEITEGFRHRQEILIEVNAREEIERGPEINGERQPLSLQDQLEILFQAFAEGDTERVQLVRNHLQAVSMRKQEAKEKIRRAETADEIRSIRLNGVPGRNPR